MVGLAGRYRSWFELPPPPPLSLSPFSSLSPLALFHTSIFFPLYTQLNFSFWPIVVEERLLVVANWKTVPANLGSLDAIRLDSTDASSNAGMSSLLAINSERKLDKNTEFQSWGFVWILATQHPTHSDLTSITFFAKELILVIFAKGLPCHNLQRDQPCSAFNAHNAQSVHHRKYTNSDVAESYYAT